MANLIRLSDDLVSGAQVNYDFDVARNPSEGGVTGRIAMRPVLREYMLSVAPSHSDEMVNVIMALRGARYPLSLRDYANNYILTDQIIPHADEVASIGRTWLPATGSLSVFERILLIDTSETPFVVKVNDVVKTITADYTFADFGKINIPGLVDGDVVKVSGQYLMAVCLVDAPSTSIIKKDLHRFADMRFHQIPEAELEKLVA